MTCRPLNDEELLLLKNILPKVVLDEDRCRRVLENSLAAILPDDPYSNLRQFDHINDYAANEEKGGAARNFYAAELKRARKNARQWQSEQTPSRGRPRQRGWWKRLVAGHPLLEAEVEGIFERLRPLIDIDRAVYLVMTGRDQDGKALEAIYYATVARRVDFSELNSIFAKMPRRPAHRPEGSPARDAALQLVLNCVKLTGMRPTEGKDVFLSGFEKFHLAIYQIGRSRGGIFADVRGAANWAVRYLRDHASVADKTLEWLLDAQYGISVDYLTKRGPPQMRNSLLRWLALDVLERRGDIRMRSAGAKIVIEVVHMERWLQPPAKAGDPPACACASEL